MLINKATTWKMADKASLNMTEGSILKNLICFAIPILIGNLFQQLYNIADTAVIGNILGDQALAAVGAAAPVYNLLIGFANGLTNGFAVIISRYFGAADKHKMNRSIALTYVLSAVTAVVLTIGSFALLDPLMRSLKTPDEILSDTERYMKIIILFSAVTIAYNMFAGMMRAIGNSKTPLYFLVVSTLVNIGLDVIFIKKFHMGVAGAAYATVIAEGVSVALCFLYALKKCKFLIFKKSELVWEKIMVADIASTGLSMGLMYAIVSVGSVILQGAVNSFGTSTITAHTAARKIDDIFMLPLGTISMAASTFASQNYGAEKTDRVKKGIRYGIIIAFLWSMISVAICIPFCRLFIHALTGTTDKEVVAFAFKYIAWNIPFFPVLGILLVLRSSLQGVGRKLIPVSGSVIELFLKILAVTILAPKLGYFGICISEPIIWIVCAAIVIVDYAVFVRRLVRNET